jgi:hypothetical protein
MGQPVKSAGTDVAEHRRYPDTVCPPELDRRHEALCTGSATWRERSVSEA